MRVSYETIEGSVFDLFLHNNETFSLVDDMELEDKLNNFIGYNFKGVYRFVCPSESGLDSWKVCFEDRVPPSYGPKKRCHSHEEVMAEFPETLVAILKGIDTQEIEIF